MKYNIIINQKSLIDNGFTDLKANHIAVLDVIASFCISQKCVKMTDETGTWVWIRSSLIVAQLPFFDIKERWVSELIKDLEKYKLVERHSENQKLGRCYLRIGVNFGLYDGSDTSMQNNADPIQETDKGMQNNADPYAEKCIPPMQKNADDKYTTYNNNKENNNNDDDSRKKSEVGTTKEKETKERDAPKKNTQNVLRLDELFAPQFAGQNIWLQKAGEEVSTWLQEGADGHCQPNSFNNMDLVYMFIFWTGKKTGTLLQNRSEMFWKSTVYKYAEKQKIDGGFQISKNKPNYPSLSEQGASGTFTPLTYKVTGSEYWKYAQSLKEARKNGLITDVEYKEYLDFQQNG